MAAAAFLLMGMTDWMTKYLAKILLAVMVLLVGMGIFELILSGAVPDTEVARPYKLSLERYVAMIENTDIGQSDTLAVTQNLDEEYVFFMAGPDQRLDFSGSNTQFQRPSHCIATTCACIASENKEKVFCKKVEGVKSVVASSGRGYAGVNTKPAAFPTHDNTALKAFTKNRTYRSVSGPVIVFS